MIIEYESTKEQFDNIILSSFNQKEIFYYIGVKCKGGTRETLNLV